MGKWIFDLQLYGNVFMVASAGLLSVGSFFSLGFLVSGLFSSPQSVLSIGQFSFLSMFLLSGAAVPRQLFPEWLYSISSYLPLTHVVELFSGLWMGEPISQYMVPLWVLIGIVVVAFPLAVRTFSWQKK